MNMRNDYLSGPYNKTVRVSSGSGRPAGRPERPHAGGGYNRGYGGGYKKGNEKRGIPVALAFAIDILAAGLIFLVFFLTQFMYSGSSEEDNTSPSDEVSIASVAPDDTQSPAEVSPTEETSASASASASAAPSSADPNDWRAKFADKLSQDGKVHQQNTADTWTYQSPNIYVNITKKKDKKVVYFVTDIYIADIKYFKTWYTDDWGSRRFTVDALKKADGVVGINGDFYAQNGGLTIRNGKYVAYQKSASDQLVMYTDGTMQTFTAANFDYKSVKAQAPDKVYQVWGFGPMLLKNGQPMTKFNSTVAKSDWNARTAIGYFEPGHYCFVTVDGRQKGYSEPGYSCTQLSNLMYTLGCKVAFNLDGGGSAQFAFMGNELNHACQGKRKNYDILYIADKA